jgi:hypothetical protein
MWWLKAKAYYLFGIKMSINSFIGSIIILFFMSLVLAVNIIEETTRLYKYIKNK